MDNKICKKTTSRKHAWIFIDLPTNTVDMLGIMSGDVKMKSRRKCEACGFIDDIPTEIKSNF
jgi:hypothetical protein